MLPCKRDRGTLRGHGGREPQLGGLCSEGSRGKGFSTWHLIRKEFEEHVAQFPWPREGTGLFSAEAVGAQDRDSPTAQTQVTLCSTIQSPVRAVHIPFDSSLWGSSAFI